MEQRYSDIMGSVMDIQSAMAGFCIQIESLTLDCTIDDIDKGVKSEKDID